jgi:hypothetical protein
MDVRYYPREGYNSVDIAKGQDFGEHIFVEIVEEHQAHRHNMTGIYLVCCTAFDSFQADDDQRTVIRVFI